MNIFEPPTSYYILNGAIEREIKESLHQIFNKNSEKGQTLDGYKNTEQFLQHITEHLDDYMKFNGNEVQLEDILLELQNKQLQQLLVREGISCVLTLADTMLTAEEVKIELTNAGQLILKPVDVSGTLNQYVVYRQEELDLPFSFSIPIDTYFPNEDYFTLDTPKNGYGLLMEMLMYIDRDNLIKDRMEVERITQQVNKLVSVIMNELIKELHQENFTILLRSLGT